MNFYSFWVLIGKWICLVDREYMPYFKWAGVDVLGSKKKGKRVAYSPDDLSEQLFNHGIALLWSKKIYAPSLLWPITARTKADLFDQKSKLLRAGLLLPQVIKIVGQQSHNPVVYDMLFAMSGDIQQGLSFTKMLEKNNTLCDAITKVMLVAGDESGNLINAMENVALYFYKQHIFSKNIRSALAMPFLTLLFFIGITSFIFVFIIPRFIDMFHSFHQDLPLLTRYMINISEFICSFSMMYLVIGIIIVVAGISYYGKTSGKKKWDRFVLKIPFLGVVIWQYHMSQALRALSLLINSGVGLVEALAIVSKSVQHELLHEQCSGLHDDVASGRLLSNAMAMTGIFLPEVVALVHIGEETGSLGPALENASLIYSDMVESQLKRFVFFLQPIMIIVLGLLVTMLIFAVYLPILQLSHVL